METKSVTVRGKRIKDAGGDVELETSDGLGIQRHTFMTEELLEHRTRRRRTTLTVGSNAVRSKDTILANQPCLVEAVHTLKSVQCTYRPSRLRRT